MASHRKQINFPHGEHQKKEMARTYPKLKELLLLLGTDVLELVRNAESELNELLDSVGVVQTLENDYREIQKRNEELEKRIVHQEKLRTDNALDVKIRQLENRLSHEERCKYEVEKKLKKRSDESEKNTSMLRESLVLAEDEIKRLNEELAIVKRHETILEKKLDTSEKFEHLYNRIKEELKSTKIELDETKSRLSKVMGDKLTDNNPNIADLSDKNRPTRLAESYQEIYDNEWTDAFETLDTIYNDEEKTISVLKNILTETSEFCRRHADYQMEQIQEALYQSASMSTWKKMGIRKQVKECRKAVAEISGNHIYLKYKKDLSATKSPLSKQVKRVPYFEEACFNLCWLMAVQDPPIVIGSNVNPGEHFDTDVYRAYTRSGNKVKYIVWPTLFLHTGGPVLSKGVAQGYTDLSRRSRSVPDKNRKKECDSKISPECYNKSFEHTKRKKHDMNERCMENGSLFNTSADDSMKSKNARKIDTPVARQSRVKHKSKTVKQSKVHTERISKPSESDIDTFLRWREMFGHVEAKRLMGDDYDICLNYLKERNII